MSQEDLMIYRNAYTPPNYLVEDVDLDVILDETNTHVTSKMKVKANTNKPEDCVLHGEDIVCEEVVLNGRALTRGTDYEVPCEGPQKDHLIIKHSVLPSEPFNLVVKNTCNPKANLALSGLYKSAQLLVTQMEAEGYRRFAYHVDRPDNLSSYRVRLEADKTLYPVLLSNGDEVASEPNLPNNRHSKTFLDPFRKPTYLFAIIAGPLKSIHDTFQTMATPEEPSKTVDLYVWCDEKYLGQVQWAMECVKKAMKWDEEVYGRVYDLRTFSVVAIEDFNAGAMENKSLTTYNVSCVLASPETSPDAAFTRVLSVIGHEYFHNWSGDRVTVRDWFQITLKEGFTNFRETCFSRDMFSYGAYRCQDVAMLRASQFVEDSGPMSHPIRPDRVVTIDNFYTSTVYEKGSQVIGMLQTLVGPEGFRKGTDLYFSRYDGCAITCDEFRNSIAEANGRDFSQFELWYSQRGTPTLKVTECAFDAANRQYCLTVEQILPANADPSGGEPKALHIPIRVGLIGKQSKKDLVGSKILELREFKQQFKIDDVGEDCVLSFLRDFSAPVKVEPFLSNEDLAFLAAYDTDPFCVWDAAQTIFKTYILERATKTIQGDPVDDKLPNYLIEIFKEGLKDRFNDLEFIATFLSLPITSSLYSEMKPFADPLVLFEIAEFVRSQIAIQLSKEINEEFEKLITISRSKPFTVTKEDVGRRSLQGLLLRLATRAEQGQSAVDRIVRFYKEAQGFNDKKIGASLICRFQVPERDDILQDWYLQCRNDPNMLDDWFRTQVLSTAPDCLERYKELLAHPDFQSTTTPNRWRAVVGASTGNPLIFHHRSGEGYKMVAQEVARFDKFNGYTAAIIAKTLIQFAYFDKPRQQQMIGTLRDLLANGLSKNTNEVVQAALATVE
eukprot:Blabericola_migrator_1__3089@NODE_18_length_22925_cov_118_464826_g15_i0_p1_GENE_NODE_18_length_22925_cov_118_464826_g15_i0NODE_18_length_22925_cov_118_464826_g15_i0_p1_ORF_typecomplete_len895_score163_40DUF3458_C/PF17432_2/2e03DUF3458_C/PF17432_2/8_8e71Peptidase_M1/PF01433_20/4_4e56DUF3458/PF11940_8/4_3e22Peptidase_M1_N/PF17900_1/1_3e20HCBP_related/PF06594_11/2_7HCBP_related/PF06594_11/3_8e02Peptidase_M61/PF05299_12/0_46_NODE_18_length_22925_cov_118_464826_g15_i01588418568